MFHFVSFILGKNKAVFTSMFNIIRSVKAPTQQFVLTER
jgi:hypothetical protein